jgi:hypothetical protein
MFLAQGGKKVKDQSLDHNEEIEVILISIEELKKLINDHQILQAMHATAILYGLKKLGYATW